MRELEELTALGDGAKAAELAAYHKVARTYLGVPVPVIDGLARAWREARDLEARLELAGTLG